MRRILIGIAVAILAATLIYFQYRMISKRNAEIQRLESQVSGLESVRAQDAKTAQGYAAEVSRVNKVNAEWARKMMEQSQNENVRDFLSIPIPDSLRDTINEYIKSKTPTH